MSKAGKYFKDVDHYRKDMLIKDELCDQPLQFYTTWGLFSPKSIDAGSRLLLDHIQINPEDHCLDVGCGYGPLGITLASKAPKGKTILIDKDFVAIEYSKKNIELNHLTNCEALLSNGFNQLANQRFNLIVSNLPAKVGNEMLSLFMIDAYNHLEPGGRFYVVTISGIRRYIERSFKQVFGNYKKVKQGKTYTVALTIKQ